MLALNRFAPLGDNDKDPLDLLLAAAQKAELTPPPRVRKPSDATKRPSHVQAVTVAKGGVGGSGGSDDWETGSESGFYDGKFGRKQGATEEEELKKYPDRSREYSNGPRNRLRCHCRRCWHCTRLPDEDEEEELEKYPDRSREYSKGRRNRLRCHCRRCWHCTRIPDEDDDRPSRRLRDRHSFYESWNLVKRDGYGRGNWGTLSDQGPPRKIEPTNLNNRDYRIVKSYEEMGEEAADACKENEPKDKKWCLQWEAL